MGILIQKALNGPKINPIGSTEKKQNQYEGTPFDPTPLRVVELVEN